MRLHPKITCAVCFIFFLMTDVVVTAGVSWETGVKAGFDSNVDRSVNGGAEDFFLSAYLSAGREPKGESRLDWLITSTVEGTVYKNISDLNSAELSVTPALIYFLSRSWSASVSPFFQAKAVRDSDQSALAFGVKADMKEQITPDFYLGQYYRYKNSSAGADVYSFEENAFGFYGGLELSRTVTCEIGYEYSHGDSFLVTDEDFESASPEPSGGERQNRRRRGARFSDAFQEFVIKEAVDRHAIGASIGINWNKSFFSTVDYTFTSLKGDAGTSRSHSGFVSLAYRF